MIGAGGVATVAAFKIVQNADVFTEFMIASRRKEKCDKLVEAMIERMKLSLVEKEERNGQTVYTLNTPLDPKGRFQSEVEKERTPIILNIWQKTR